MRCCRSRSRRKAERRGGRWAGAGLNGAWRRVRSVGQVKFHALVAGDESEAFIEADGVLATFVGRQLHHRSAALGAVVDHPFEECTAQPLAPMGGGYRSEEHTSELQSPGH